MASVTSAPRRLDSRRAARFVQLYQACISAGQNHDDLARACGVTPINLTHFVEEGGRTTLSVLGRLEKWAALINVTVPREPQEPDYIRAPASSGPSDESMSGTNGHGLPGRRHKASLDESKATKHQHHDFHAICRELKDKYKLSNAERLRATGYRSMTGLAYALKHGPKVWVFERAKFVRNALVAGTSPREEIFLEAERRWPVPQTGIRAPRKRKGEAHDRSSRRRGKTLGRPGLPTEARGPEASTEGSAASEASRNGDANARGAAVKPRASETSPRKGEPGLRNGEASPRNEEIGPWGLPALPTDIQERLIRGFGVIERCVVDLERIFNALIELATDPGMPRTVRKTAGEMANGLSARVLPAIETRDAAEAPPAP